MPRKHDKDMWQEPHDKTQWLLDLIDMGEAAVKTYEKYLLKTRFENSSASSMASSGVQPSMSTRTIIEPMGALGPFNSDMAALS